MASGEFEPYLALYKGLACRVTYHFANNRAMVFMVDNTHKIFKSVAGIMQSHGIVKRKKLKKYEIAALSRTKATTGVVRKSTRQRL